MQTPALHPTLVQHFEKLRAGAGVAYVLIAMGGAALLGGVAYVFAQPRFEAWTLLTLLPSLLIAALARKVYKRVSDPLSTPEAVALQRGTLVAFYVHKTNVRAVGAHVGSLYAIVLELPGRKQAYLNPVDPQDQSALLHALALQCPDARRGPS